MDDGAAFLGEHVAQPVHTPAVGEGDDDRIAHVGGKDGGAKNAAALATGVAEDGEGSPAAFGEGEGEFIEDVLVEGTHTIEKSLVPFGG